MSETAPRADEIDEKARRNWPDIGGPSWHESKQQIQQEYNQQRHEYEARLRHTLLSAIQRGVIPDIWNLPDHDGLKGDDERLYFLIVLENPSQQQDGAMPWHTVYSDDDLRRAWRRTQNNFEELRRYSWNKAYAYAVSKGLLPSPNLTDPDLYRRYYLEAFQMPLAPIPHYLQVWDRVKTEWETTRKAAEIGAKSISSESNNTPKPREQRGMNANTEAKVREAHRLLTAGTKWAVVKKTCSYETYMQWCQAVTGEKPITKL